MKGTNLSQRLNVHRYLEGAIKFVNSYAVTRSYMIFSSGQIAFCQVKLVLLKNVAVFTYTATLKWYYDQKITFIFSSNFETLFIKHSPSEILSLNFDKKTVYLNFNFPI